MKLKQAILPCAIALAMASGILGCKDDSGAVSALQELTTKLSEQVAETNETLTSLAAEVETCMKDLADTKGQAVVITSKSADVPVPSLEGEATTDSLNALKKALNDAADKQKAALAELGEKKDQCVKDLEAARAEADAADAKAARKSAAKESAEAKKKTVERSEAGQQREAEGRPATGIGSRQKKR